MRGADRKRFPTHVFATEMRNRAYQIIKQEDREDENEQHPDACGQIKQNQGKAGNQSTSFWFQKNQSH